VIAPSTNTITLRQRTRPSAGFKLAPVVAVMDKKTSKKDASPTKARGAGKVTFAQVRQRARELAAINGRGPHDLLESDYEQARRELGRDPAGDEKMALLEAVPESARWDPVPGTAGHQALELASDDEEDDDGHNESAQLVEGGMIEAEDDQAT
jgi:hypothetical protein